MTEESIQKIRQLKTQLLNERVYFFSAKRYRDIFIYKINPYELEAYELTKINNKPINNRLLLINTIIQLVGEYHQLPWWKKGWLLLTTPMRIYQRIYDIDTLSRIEVAAKQDAAQVQQLYDRSFLKPEWLDIVLNTWRVKLQKMIGTLPQQPDYPLINIIVETSSASHMQDLHNKPDSKLCINSKLVAMSTELSKGKDCSITKLVDIYEELKFDPPTIDTDMLRRLERQMLLVIHPDKNLPSQIEEATKQFQRFREIQDKIVNKNTLHPDYIALQQLSRDIARYKEQQDKYYNDLMEQLVQREQWFKNELNQLQSQQDQQNLKVDKEIQRLKDGQNRFKNQLDQIFQQIGLNQDDTDTNNDSHSLSR